MEHILHSKNFLYLKICYQCQYTRVITTLSSTTFPHTCFFLAWGLTFILVPTRIIINHRIILTVRIQIQPVSTVHILLHKPSQHRIVKPCPQIILPAGLVILLSRVKDSVVELFHAVFEHAKRIVLVPVFYLPAASRDVGSAVLLVQMIVVVTVLFPVPPCRHPIPGNITAYSIAVWTALCEEFPVMV